MDVGTAGGVAFGHSVKFRALHDALGADQPVFWLDDIIGGKDEIWAEDRTAVGVPTVAHRVDPWRGLTRADVDAALAWLRRTTDRCGQAAGRSGPRG